MSTLTIGTFTLEHPIMNAAGPRCKTVEEIIELAKSPVAAIMVGSVTCEERTGNTGETYYYSSKDRVSFNSLGLPNGGYNYYEKNLPEMVSVAHHVGKPLLMSAAGFSPKEYATLAQLAAVSGADGVELNLGCPNVWLEKSQKRPMCFDFNDVETTLRSVCGSLIEVRTPDHFEIWVKLSPFSDPQSFDDTIWALWELKRVIPFRLGITVINTFANGFMYGEDGQSVIQSPDVPTGLAGVSGVFMKYIGLGHVHMVHNRLGLYAGFIKVIGVGGIWKKADVEDYLRAGASLVQIGTAHAERGARIFSDILEEYV